MACNCWLGYEYTPARLFYIKAFLSTQNHTKQLVNVICEYHKSFMIVS